MNPASADVTPLLREVTRGNQDALSRLMPLIYDELRFPLDAPRVEFTACMCTSTSVSLRNFSKPQSGSTANSLPRSSHNDRLSRRFDCALGEK